MEEHIPRGSSVSGDDSPQSRGIESSGSAQGAAREARPQLEHPVGDFDIDRILDSLDSGAGGFPELPTTSVATASSSGTAHPGFDFSLGSDQASDTTFSSQVLSQPTIPNTCAPTDIFGPQMASSMTIFTSVPATASDDFADDRIISVPMIQCVQAGLQIAAMLDCIDTIWDPSFLRVVSPAAFPPLPPCLVPTEAQQTIPHHPFIDILPWPKVRTKLCYVFAQPAHLRPPIARTEAGAVAMAWDIDDEQEGMRLYGGDAFRGCSWEVGQAFFKNWWWALDREVVENSNQLRASRGVGRLRLGP